jgi:hypothetical protein
MWGAYTLQMLAVNWSCGCGDARTLGRIIRRLVFTSPAARCDLKLAFPFDPQAQSPEDLNGIPQQGANEKGLFFVIAAD